MTVDLVREALSEPEGVRAVARGDIGTVVRLARQAVGLHQGELAAMIGKSQSAISRLEKGHTADPVQLARLIGPVLGIAPEALGILQFDASDPHMLGHDVGMKRRDTFRAFFTAAAILAIPKFLVDEPPARLSKVHVDECRAVLRRVDAEDTKVGGEAVYGISRELVSRIQRLARTTRYSSAVGADLQAVLAAGYETAGWMAYDTGRLDDAHSLWKDGLNVAQIHGLSAIRVTTMADMALHAATRGWGAEAVSLSRVASKEPGVTPGVASLLAAREGIGHALLRDPRAANAAFAQAARLMDKGRSPDDPAWVSFWGPDDFACHRSKAALILGDVRTAEQAGRAALAGAQHTEFGRNRVLYTVRVGNILTRRGALDEATALLRPVVAGTIGSGRVRSELRATVARLAEHRNHRPTVEFARWADRMLVSA